MVNTKSQPLIINIMGPTAAGKTDLALTIASHHDCSIISVDSAMIYRGMNIGTAKPCEHILHKFPHALINICDPRDSYSAEQFRRDALCAINDALAQEKIPLLVGGTMLYFRALFQGLSPLPTRDEEIRQKIDSRAAKEGWDVLHAELMQIDPESAKRIHPNDPQRLQRALEIYYLTGKPMSALFKKSATGLENMRTLSIALAPMDRSILHQRIEKRFLQMLEEGLVEEVQKLHQRADLHEKLPAIRAVGYRQVWQYLEEQIDYATMTERGIFASRQLAKRQLTWLRKWPELIWFDSEDKEREAKVLELIQKKCVTPFIKG